MRLYVQRQDGHDFLSLKDLTPTVADDINESNWPGEALTVECDITDWDMVESVVNEALQIHGASGYQREHLVYRYRLARGRRLAAGTDETQKNTIANVLKKDGRSSLT